MWFFLLLILVCLLVPAAFKKRVPIVQNVNQGVVAFDDFIEVSSNIADPFNYIGIYFQSSTTSSAQITPVYSTIFPGAVSLYIEDQGDTAVLETLPVLNLSVNNLLDVQTRFMMTSLGTGSQIHKTSFGFSDNFADRSSESNAAVIYYDLSISPNYICYVKDQINGTSQVITTVAAAANTDTYFRVTITPNVCYFYINNVLVATINNSPVTANLFSLGWSREKTVGNNTGSSLYVDAIGITQQLTTPRTFVNP